MNIEKAISHAELLAEKNKEHAEMFRTFSGDTGISDMKKTAEKCERIAEEHIQLAEWLKALRDIKKIIDIDNSVIQEDVMKYKAICDIVNKALKESEVEE